MIWYDDPGPSQEEVDKATRVEMDQLAHILVDLVVSGQVSLPDYRLGGNA